MEHILEYRTHPRDPRGTPFGFAIVDAICGRGGTTRRWNAGMGRTRGWPQSLGHIGHPHLSHGPPIDHRCGGHRKDVHNRQHLQVLETYKEG